MRAVSVGCAPCVGNRARRWDPRRGRCTVVLLGDDVVGRCSRSSLARLRRRLRRFLPASAGGVAGFVRLGTALAGSALEQGLGAAARATKSDDRAPKPTDDDELRLPGDVFYLKPRADGSVGIYRGGASRGREELLWQLNDVLLSKSMLAHATAGAYVSALDRV